MTKRRITCLCLAVLLLLPTLLSGCGKKPEPAFSAYKDIDGSLCETATVTLEGSDYTLTWFKDQQRFMLKDTISGDEFYSTPDRLVSDETCSPLVVDYLKPNAQNLSTADSMTDCIDYYTNLLDSMMQQGKELTDKDWALQDKLAFSVEQIPNGFRATYSFPGVQITVPVEYLLTKSGVKVQVPMDRVREGKNKIYEIRLTPYFASATNDLETDSYMMVPSGGGALIQARCSGLIKEYYEAVYGEDQAEPNNIQVRLQSQIYLPVFGVTTTTLRADETGEPIMGSEQQIGLVGVIEDGADCAMVYAKTGGEERQFSCAYASFCIRSKEKVVYNSQGGHQSTGTRYSDAVTQADNLSVHYLPLSAARGQDTSYNGMAKRYRQYLQERGHLQTKTEKAPTLSVNLLGGTQVTESLFGVPYQSDVATTTLAQTQDIVSQLTKLVGDDSLLVSLVGYGQGGLANTEVGGGFKLSSKVGKQKELDALISYAKKHGIVLSMDYELAQFQGGGNGIQIGKDTALGVSKLKAKLQTYQMHMGTANEKGLSWYLLARKELSTMMDKAIAAVNKNKVGGISIGSLNRIVYSDFRTEGYAAMSGFSSAVVSQLQKAAKEGLTVVADDANAYAVLQADYVTGVPMHSTRFNMIDQDIPFYAMVFQGYKPLTSASINLAVNVRDTYLKALATGMGLQFTLCDTLHDSIQFDEDTAFVSSRYKDWKDQIAEMVKESSDLLAKVGNQSIVRYEKHGDVSVTQFANGTTVIVNYADEAVTFEGTELAANSFIYR